MPLLVPAPRRPAASRLCAGAVLACALAAAAAASAATLEITGPAGAAVKVNGVEMGLLPLAEPLTLGAGAYLVEADLPGHRPFARNVRLESAAQRLRLVVRCDRLSRRTAWTSSVAYAGLGQFYLDKPLRGWVYAAAETGGLLAALAGELQRSNFRKDYIVLMDNYASTINGNDAAEFRRQAERAYADMEDAEQLRNVGLIVAVSAVGISVVDALLSFPQLEAGPGPVPMVSGAAPALPAAAGNSLTAVHAAVKLTF